MKKILFFLVSVFFVTASLASEQSTTPEDILKKAVGSQKVSVVEGTIQEIYMSKLLPAEQVIHVREYSDALLMLESGNVSFTFCNIGNATGYMAKDSSLHVVVSKLLQTTCCFGVNKDNQALLEDINRFLTEHGQKGELDSIHNRWFKAYDKGEMPKLDFSNAQKVLRIGSGCASVPFTFISNGTNKGIDMEVISRYAYATGQKPEVVQLPFNSLIAALLTHKVDVIANSISPTAERKKSINFSLPYDKNFSVLLGKSRPDAGAVVQKTSWFHKLKESFTANLLTERRYMLIITGLKETLLISVLSILLGTLFGAIVCYLRMHRSRLLSSIGKIYIDLIRGMPVLVLLMITYYVIFANSSLSATSVAIFTFALNFGAYVSEMFRSSISSIDKGQHEAGIAMGFTPFQSFRYIIAPQALTRVMPVYKGETISLIKMTSIVGYIAVQDLTKASDIIRSRTFDAFFPLIFVAIIYFLLAWIFMLLLNMLTNKVTRKR